VAVWVFITLVVVGLVAWLAVKHFHPRNNNSQASVPSTLAWTADRAPGIGPDNFSSPVDSAGLFPFVLYETVHADTIRALNTDSGSQLWDFTSDSDSTATGDPAASGNQLVLGSDGQAFFAVDAGTGQLQWRQLWPNGDQGLGPQISGGVAAIANQRTGQVYAYNATTGIPMWTSAQDDQLGFDHPQDFTIAASTAFIMTDHYLAAYNAHDGRLKWLVTLTSPGDNSQAQQIAGATSGRIIVTGDSWIEALSISSGHKLWRDSLPDSGPKWPLVSAQVVIANVCEGDVDCTSGQMLGIDPMTGHQLWYHPTVGEWNFEEPPGEWLGAGRLLQWQPGPDPSDNTIAEIQLRTGKTLKAWNVNGTMPQYMVADSNKIYIINYDSSVVAVHE
jgi:outer membrane protein assembly factor BamB